MSDLKIRNGGLKSHLIARQLSLHLANLPSSSKGYTSLLFVAYYKNSCT